MKSSIPTTDKERENYLLDLTKAYRNMLSINGKEKDSLLVVSAADDMTTSVIPILPRRECNPLYEMDIMDKTPAVKSRLQFTDIRSIDIMRVCRSVHPNSYDVITDRNAILQKFQDLILTQEK